MVRFPQAFLHSIVAFAAVASSALTAAAATVTGSSSPSMTSGQFMSIDMTIDDNKTRFELIGPDFSWFAFGFDTTTMAGYSLIIQGTDAARTAVEQNIVGIGQPGSPQATQNISIISTEHLAAQDLTKIVIERVNNTGDSNDPIFSPSMSSLNVISGFDSFSSPAFPNPNLSYHGSGGRGFGRIEFSPVPEPTTLWLIGATTFAFTGYTRRRSR